MSAKLQVCLPMIYAGEGFDAPRRGFYPHGMLASVRERIYAFTTDKGLRKTSQRDAIIEAAFSTTEHYTGGR